MMEGLGLGLGSGATSKKAKKRDPMDERVDQILLDNRSLNFVDRIIHRENYPIIDEDPRLAEDDWATHQMSWSDDGEGHYYVYPDVYWDAGSKSLVWPEDPAESERHAQETGEYIEFDSAEEADWFSKEYKRYWNK